MNLELPAIVPAAIAAEPVPDKEQSESGSGCADSASDTCLPEMLAVSVPEKMTSVTGGDVSTRAGPDAALPS